jgi:hypothetical protein
MDREWQVAIRGAGFSAGLPRQGQVGLAGGQLRRQAEKVFGHDVTLAGWAGKSRQAIFIQQSPGTKARQGQIHGMFGQPGHVGCHRQDVAYANSVGVQATPTFLIGRIEDGNMNDINAISGAMSFDSFAQTVDAVANPH